MFTVTFLADWKYSGLPWNETTRACTWDGGRQPETSLLQAPGCCWAAVNDCRTGDKFEVPGYPACTLVCWFVCVPSLHSTDVTQNRISLSGRGSRWSPKPGKFPFLQPSTPPPSMLVQGEFSETSYIYVSSWCCVNFYSPGWNHTPHLFLAQKTS